MNIREKIEKISSSEKIIPEKNAIKLVAGSNQAHVSMTSKSESKKSLLNLVVIFHSLYEQVLHCHRDILYFYY